MLSLCDYTDAYILVKGTIENTGAGADAAARQAGEWPSVLTHWKVLGSNPTRYLARLRDPTLL